MDWFDCHAEFGPRIVPGGLEAVTAGALATLYAEIGIQQALVMHPAQHEHHPRLGNARVVAETREYPQFTPAWALLPPHTEELGDVPTFLAAMRAANVRALWAFPHRHNYALDALTLGPLLDALVERGIPLFVKVETLPRQWETLAALLREAPALRVVAVTNNLWGTDRYFRPLVARFPGFHLCTSLYVVGGGLSAFCARYGPRQLLFGTSFPEVQPGASLLALLHSGLPEADMAAIAGGNLRRLLEEVTL